MREFSRCKQIKLIYEENPYPFRYDFFENKSIIAIKMDLEPLESKEFILRCYV